MVTKFVSIGSYSPEVRTFGTLIRLPEKTRLKKLIGLLPTARMRERVTVVTLSVCHFSIFETYTSTF